MKKLLIIGFALFSITVFSQRVTEVTAIDVSASNDSLSSVISMKNLQGRSIDVFFSTLDCNDAVMYCLVSHNDSTGLIPTNWTSIFPLTLDKTNATYIDKINTDQMHFGINADVYNWKYFRIYLSDRGSCTSGTIVIQY